MLSKEEAGIAGIAVRERLSEVSGGLLALLLPIEAVEPVEAVEALIDAADDDETLFAEVDADVMLGAGTVTGAPLGLTSAFLRSSRNRLRSAARFM